MKAYFTASLLFFVFGGSCFGAIKDPVAGYLALRNTPEFISYRGDQQFYADDRVYRIDVDLNNDGEKEVLVSSSLDQDGKQGNVFYVFEQRAGGYENIGQMHLSPNGFYLGEISEINGYGIVKFWPSGGGEGGISAYVLDGDSIIEKAIGEVMRDPGTSKLKGRELLDKYSGSNPSIITNDLTTIDANQLAKNYGIKVEPKSYLQALQEGFPGSTPIKVAPTPTGTPAVAKSTPVPATPTPSPVEKSTPQPTASPMATPETKSAPSEFPIVPVAIAVAVIVGILIFFLRRRST